MYKVKTVPVKNREVNVKYPCICGIYLISQNAGAKKKSGKADATYDM